MGNGIFLAVVVVSMWVNSPGEDWEGLGIIPCPVSRCGDTCEVTELQRRDITSWRVTSEIPEITEFHPFFLVLSPFPPSERCLSSCGTSRRAQDTKDWGSMISSASGCKSQTGLGWKCPQSCSHSMGRDTFHSPGVKTSLHGLGIQLMIFFSSMIKVCFFFPIPTFSFFSDIHAWQSSYPSDFL